MENNDDNTEEFEMEDLPEYDSDANPKDDFAPHAEKIPGSTIETLAVLAADAVKQLFLAIAYMTKYEGWTVNDAEFDYWKQLFNHVLPYVPLKFLGPVLIGINIAIINARKTISYFKWKSETQKVQA